MDALAAWQINKKQQLADLKATTQITNSSRISTYEEEKKLNKLFGFPDPPPRCFCLGRDASAAVWWTYEDLEGIIGWEVHRYRKDGNVWQNKGFVHYDTLSPLQVIVTEINNGHEYRFTVKAINAKGPGLESPPSNSVYVDSPLPPGWYRFFDRKADKHYFASLKTGRSSWTRPELDPNFLGDDVYKRFKPKEISFLRKLYEEDMEHFRSIKADQVPEIIREIGERLTAKKIAYFFNMISGDPQKLTNWQQFMQFMVAIKEEKNRKTITITPFQYFFRCIRRQQLKADLKSSRNKLGAWVIEYNGLLQKHFYRNTETGVSSWLIPDEVKFYLPKKLEAKLFKIFDPGQIEDMKTYFALLDIDNSGDLSQKEISLLLDAMGVKIDDKELENLIKTIDVNGNGTVEFDEFCWMMFELAKKDNLIVSKQSQRNAIAGFLSTSMIPSEANNVSNQRGLTFSGLKRAVSIMRRDVEDDKDDNSSIVSAAGSQLKRAFSSFRGNVSGGGDSVVSESSASKSWLPSVFTRSNKVADSNSKTSPKKPEKKKPDPNLYKPKPKKILRRQTSSKSVTKVQQESDSEDDYEDEDDDDDGGGYAFTKQKSGSFFGLTRNASQRSTDSNADTHEKDCMCGCRRF